MGHTPEEYIREVYRIHEQGMPLVGPTELAKVMDIGKATAYEALNNLADHGYGTYIKGKGLMLNETGIEEAESAMRRHRLLECYMADTLDLSSKDICSEVSHIDCHIGTVLIEALESKYGKNKICPCGNEIPERRID